MIVHSVFQPQLGEAAFSCLIRYFFIICTEIGSCIAPTAGIPHHPLRGGLEVGAVGDLDSLASLVFAYNNIQQEL